MSYAPHRQGWCKDQRTIPSTLVSMENPVVPINLPFEEMIKEQRDEVTRLAKEPQLAELAGRADTANFTVALAYRN
ncbi:hypothetical protein HAX54_036161 [Datura stramonium]|uniref:Uncharacterized protein n=1 Tax=Datura stramonium TaxID=4076 RepID=A0ABS8SG63_DATST|nr:hypothetical protein [Datura stramonium]